VQTAAEMPVARLLWTGGWDSTFRLLQLLLVEGRTVQPYYVIDRVKLRPGGAAERRAMQTIREAFGKRHPQARDRLHPTIECSLEDVAPDARISNYYEQSLKFGFIGGQYEWLARFCAQRGIDDMELSIHRDDKARELIANLIDSSRVRLDARFAGDGRYELFKAFRFPLFDWSKEQMRAEARRAGFEQFMDLTWFCHRPIRGEPCGTCNPCIYTIQEGLGDRVPRRGMRRYRFRVVPRIRSALARNIGLYLAARSLYRSLRR
jgi:tRNA(Ile)-lysidine synthase TilS/MesJ